MSKTLSVAAVAFATLTLAGAAHAATGSFTDSRNDVAHGVDLRSVTVENGNKNVWVTTRHDDLRPHHSSAAGLTVFIDTDRNDAGPEYALVAGLFEGTDYSLLATEGWNLRKNTTRVECSYDLAVNYATDVAKIRLDRGCLDDARDVRVEVRTGADPAEGAVKDWLGSAHTFTSPIVQG